MTLNLNTLADEIERLRGDQAAQKAILEAKWAEVCCENVKMEIAIAVMTGVCLSEGMRQNMDICLSLVGAEISYRMQFGQPSSAPVARRDT